MQVSAVAERYSACTRQILFDQNGQWRQLLFCHGKATWRAVAGSVRQYPASQAALSRISQSVWVSTTFLVGMMEARRRQRRKRASPLQPSTPLPEGEDSRRADATAEPAGGSGQQIQRRPQATTLLPRHRYTPLRVVSISAFRHSLVIDPSCAAAERNL